MKEEMKDIFTAFKVRTLIWDCFSLKLIDQRKLPFEETYIDCRTPEDVFSAIKNMVVRGAPAIGVAAAYGAALAAIQCKNISGLGEFIDFMSSKIELLASSRPTAVNLSWALERINRIIDSQVERPVAEDDHQEKIRAIIGLIIKEAENIEEEDIRINIDLGENIFRITGKSRKKFNILTHCNAGALATAGYGTALGVIRSLNRAGMVKNVIVDETRPYLQGARLTAWELYREKIPFFIITDNMAGYFMSKGDVDMVVTGADRIAANGDAANKIGTLPLSVLAKNYNIPFYIAAPLSTIDINTPDGKLIPIEQRPEEEVRSILGRIVIPPYMPVSNPSFDVTPNQDISAIITEKGVIYPPFGENIRSFF